MHGKYQGIVTVSFLGFVCLFVFVFGIESYVAQVGLKLSRYILKDEVELLIFPSLSPEYTGITHVC